MQKATFENLWINVKLEMNSIGRIEISIYTSDPKLLPVKQLEEVFVKDHWVSVNDRGQMLLQARMQTSHLSFHSVILKIDKALRSMGFEPGYFVSFNGWSKKYLEDISELLAVYPPVALRSSKQMRSKVFREWYQKYNR